MERIQIIWFKRDLRIQDNPLLSLDFCFPVLPIFIFDKNLLQKLPKNDRRVSFILDQITKLKENLIKINLNLALFSGAPLQIFDYLSHQYQIVNIFSSTDNDPYSKQRDVELSRKYNLKIKFDNFIIDPEKIKTKQGKVYTVFTHFKNAVKEIVEELRTYKTLEISPRLKLAHYDKFNQIIEIENTKVLFKPVDIKSIGFERQKVDFDGVIKTPQELLSQFSKVIDDYETIRNLPSLRGTSLLSTHLRFGTISIRELVRWALVNNANTFLSELIWRDFFNYILYNFPETTNENLQKNVKIEWSNNTDNFERFVRAETGIPLVDAGIRELVQTGYMHNRVRMVVASFLTKNLLIDWKWGEDFFARHLFDYETSSNVGNWQWVAGVGTDPRSATRIFNPFLQSKKFDPECEYIYRYVPELRNIPPIKIHDPEFIFNSKILGYPKPIIKDLKSCTLAFSLAYKKNT